MLAMKPVLRAFALVLVATLALSAQQAKPVPAGAGAASVGISTERLNRLHAGMQGFIDRKEVGGIVTLVARDGKVVDLTAYGFQDVERKTAMKTDSIFRIASMTKPITSVAIMMLYEEGKLALTDQVSRYIPAFKQQRVAEGGPEPVNARRGMNLRDLLSHRSGLTYGFLNGAAVGNGYRKNGVTDGLTATTMTLEEGINKLAAEPLVAHPGAAFNYSLSTDVLGRVVEVVSGQPFNVFLRERIFKPLKMADTDFVVPDAKWPRLTTVYSPQTGGGIRPMQDPETFGNTVMSPIAYYKEPKTYFSGGAGLTSTAGDYGRFAQMLLNGGSLDGVQILSPKSIELMTRSQTSDLTPPVPLLGNGINVGLGFRLVTDLGATLTLDPRGCTAGAAFTAPTSGSIRRSASSA